MSDERRTVEYPTTVTVRLAHPVSQETVPVYTREAIIALQAAGYEVFEATELPEVRVENGKPRLSSNLGEPVPANAGKTRAQLYYEEALGKLALARWWEREAVRAAKREEAMLADLHASADTTPQSRAKFLIERGWRRG